MRMYDIIAKKRDGGTLDYRGLNISRDIMLELADRF